jgi:hypothetical protein
MTRAEKDNPIEIKPRRIAFIDKIIDRNVRAKTIKVKSRITKATTGKDCARPSNKSTP